MSQEAVLAAEKQRRKTRLRACCITVGGLLLLGIAIYVALPSIPLYRMMLGIRFNRSACSKIVSEIEHGKLTPNKSGVVSLPADLAWASDNGTVYITSKGSSNLIFFPTWTGRDMMFAGYLHSSTALSVGDRIDLLVGGPLGSMTYGAEVTEDLDGGWYKVENHNG